MVQTVIHTYNSVDTVLLSTNTRTFHYTNVCESTSFVDPADPITMITHLAGDTNKIYTSIAGMLDDSESLKNSGDGSSLCKSARDLEFTLPLPDILNPNELDLDGDTEILTTEILSSVLEYSNDRVLNAQVSIIIGGVTITSVSVNIGFTVEMCKTSVACESDRCINEFDQY